MSSETSSPPTITDAIHVNNHALLNINMVNVTKLTAMNYLMWKLQVHALVDGYGLASHLDGSTVIPSTTVTISDVVSQNPEFVLWHRQDKLIYSSLLGSISLNVQSTLSQTTTAAEIWSTLADTYAKPSRGHVKQLRDQLKNWTKASRTIDDYLHGLKTRFDNLASLGQPMQHEDQIELILEGLPEEFKSVADQIEGRDTSPTIAFVHERLLNHEAKLLSKAASSLLPITANVATQRNNNNNNRSGQSNYNNNQKQRYNNNGNNTQNQNWQQSSNKSEQRGPKPYLGRCQICSVHGHSARRCPHLQNRTQMTLSSTSQPIYTMAASRESSPWFSLSSGSMAAR